MRSAGRGRSGGSLALSKGPLADAEPKAAAAEGPPVLVLSDGRLLTILSLVVLVLGLLGLAVPELERWQLQHPWLAEVQESLVRLFSLDREANVPTWFSTLLLALCAACAALCGALAPDRYPRGRWFLMAALFFAMSLDEAALFHEMSIKPLRHLMGTSGLLYYAWVIPGAAAVCAVILYYGRFILALSWPVRHRLVAGAAIYVLGALVIEAFTGSIEERSGRNAVYHLTAAIEEIFEMVGLVVIIAGLLLHARTRSSSFVVRLHGRTSS